MEKHSTTIPLKLNIQHTCTRWLIFFSLLCVMVILFFIIIYGNIRTVYIYAPSISQLLSEFIELSVLLEIVAFVYIFLETFLSIEYEFHDPPLVNNDIHHYSCYERFIYLCRRPCKPYRNILPIWGRVFSFLRMLCFLLIPVLRVDEYPTIHNLFALGCVIFSELYGIMFYLRRQLEDNRNKQRKFMLTINLLVLILIPTFSFIYIIPAYISHDFQYYDYWNLFEYVIFFLIGFLSTFIIYDLDQHKYSVKFTQIDGISRGTTGSLLSNLRKARNLTSKLI